MHRSALLSESSKVVLGDVKRETSLSLETRKEYLCFVTLYILKPTRTLKPRILDTMASSSNEEKVDLKSPNPLERRDSLEKHLQMRPEEKDLKDRHILLDTTAAPALQARAAELERQRITDNLKKVAFA